MYDLLVEMEKVASSNFRNRDRARRETPLQSISIMKCKCEIGLQYPSFQLIFTPMRALYCTNYPWRSVNKIIISLFLSRFGDSIGHDFVQSTYIHLHIESPRRLGVMLDKKALTLVEDDHRRGENTESRIGNIRIF